MARLGAKLKVTRSPRRKTSGLYGDWNKVKKKIFKISKGIQLTGNTLLRQMGRLYMDKVIGHIKKQDLKFVALKPSTIAKKGHALFYIDKGKFLSRLKLVTVTNQKHDFKLAGGAFGNVTYDNRRSMLDIARMNNDGTKFIKPRRLFTISLRETIRGTNIPRGMQKFVRDIWTFPSV